MNVWKGIYRVLKQTQGKVVRQEAFSKVKSNATMLSTIGFSIEIASRKAKMYNEYLYFNSTNIIHIKLKKVELGSSSLIHLLNHLQ